MSDVRNRFGSLTEAKLNSPKFIFSSLMAALPNSFQTDGSSIVLHTRQASSNFRICRNSLYCLMGSSDDMLKWDASTTDDRFPSLVAIEISLLNNDNGVWSESIDVSLNLTIYLSWNLTIRIRIYQTSTSLEAISIKKQMVSSTHHNTYCQ